MTLVDRIADVLMEHKPTGKKRRSKDDHMLREQCSCGDWDWEPVDHWAAEIASVVRPRIDTIDQLDALPDLSIVGVRMPIGGERWTAPHLYAIQRDGEWFGAGGGEQIDRAELAAALDATSALLLYTPEEP